MWTSNEIHSTRKDFHVPVNVVLRECSVVIVGSTCKICGSHFKCESDVALHTQWRHNGVIESLINKIGYEIYPEKIGQKCDICNIYLDPNSDLKIHKRLIHKDRHNDRKISRKKTVRLKFKLKGVTTLDKNLDRKYLKISPVRYFVDADIKTDMKVLKADTKLLKNEGQNNCFANIDSLPAHFVADNGHIQYGTQVHKANQYIIGNFASTKHNTVAYPTDMVGRNSTEISNPLHKDGVIGSDNSCKKHENRRDFTSQNKKITFINSRLIDDIIEHYMFTIDIYKESLRRIDKQKRRKKREKKREKKVHSQNENSVEDPKMFSICQRDKSDKITTSMFKQNCCFNKSCYNSIRWLNEAKRNKRTGLTSSLAGSMEIHHNINSNNFDGDTTKRSPVHLTRLHEKDESMRVNSNVDDDVQEVLRITRGNLQSDINHESPNRTERERLMQNTINKINKLPLQREPTIHPKKYGSEFTTNLRAFDYSSYIPITKKDSEYLSNAFDKKLGIYLKDLDRYGIKYYNDIQEINNNNLEDYEVHAHQGFFESWVQAVEPQYTNTLEVNDNEAIVTLD